MLGNINRRITAKAAATVAAQALRQSTQGQEQAVVTNTGYSANEYASPTDASITAGAMKTDDRTDDFGRTEQGAVAGEHPAYRHGRHGSSYSYPEPSVSSAQVYQGNPAAYAQPVYTPTAGEAATAQHVQQLPPSGDAVQAPGGVYNMTGNASNMYYAGQNFANPAAEWVRWGQLNLPLSSAPDGPQDYVSSATALVALGGRGVNAQDPAPTIEDASNWPLNLFNAAQQNGAAGA